jgi:hypothetical protein
MFEAWIRVGMRPEIQPKLMCKRTSGSTRAMYDGSEGEIAFAKILKSTDSTRLRLVGYPYKRYSLSTLVDPKDSVVTRSHRESRASSSFHDL